MQNYINIVLSSKGGVGKTVIATFLYEYLIAKKKQKTVILNTDTSNKDLQESTWYRSVFVDFKDDSGVITPKKLTELTEKFGTKNLVIDVGANSYYPWITFLSQMDGVAELELFGAKVILHVVLVGGTQFGETVKCLQEICNLKLPVEIVVHLNNVFAEDSSYYLPNPLEIATKPEIEPYTSQIKTFIPLPECRVIEKDTFDTIKKLHLSLSEIADADLETQKRLASPNALQNDNRVKIFKARSIRYREKVFNALKALDVYYDVK